MSDDYVEWTGTDSEQSAFLAAITRYCECKYDESGAKAYVCPSHKSMVHEQRFINGLIEGRRRADALMFQEFKSEP